MVFIRILITAIAAIVLLQGCQSANYPRYGCQYEVQHWPPMNNPEVDQRPKLGFPNPPYYPDRLRSRGIEGWVMVQFTITEQGTVVGPEVLDSFPKGSLFEGAAVKSISAWRFEPALKGGKAVSFQAQRLVQFCLQLRS